MSLLWMGESHRGTAANNAEYQDGRFRVHSHIYIQPSAVILPYLELAGFANVAKIASLKVDSKLIVALLERWRPETHTFHLPTGECTITLEDVSMLLGLRIHGKVVNGPTNVTNDVYMENLGIEPTTSDKNGASVKIVWLEAIRVTICCILLGYL
ncbi:protein MAIN-LIKE 2-like [Lathyrus oleraceus]|uniref:protein MAIN-LIKE 2-like n=1 Tax=Pisum sativum TaxID=3888 RepID=UPI0021CF7687|nr:protein MAIN-LIKE 2-like [Pisum sativum]